MQISFFPSLGNLNVAVLSHQDAKVRRVAFFMSFVFLAAKAEETAPLEKQQMSNHMTHLLEKNRNQVSPCE